MPFNSEVCRMFLLFCYGSPVLILLSTYGFQNERGKSFAKQQYSRPRKWISAWCASCSQPSCLTAMGASHGNLILLYQMQYMTAVSRFGFHYCFNVGQAFAHTELFCRYCYAQTHLALLLACYLIKK